MTRISLLFVLLLATFSCAMNTSLVYRIFVLNHNEDDFFSLISGTVSSLDKNVLRDIENNATLYNHFEEWTSGEESHWLLAQRVDTARRIFRCLGDAQSRNIGKYLVTNSANMELILRNYPEIVFRIKRQVYEQLLDSELEHDILTNEFWTLMIGYLHLRHLPEYRLLDIIGEDRRWIEITLNSAVHIVESQAKNCLGRPRTKV